MKEFLTSNSTYYRLLRTIVQGVIAVVIANLDIIFGWVGIPSEYKAILVAVVMAILSPIMKLLGGSSDDDK